MTPTSIVTCLFNARGDYLLNLPALRALSAKFADQLVLVVRRGAFETFLRDVGARAVVEADIGYEDGAYRFDIEAVVGAVLAHGPVDRFISLNPWAAPQLDELCARLTPQRSAGLGRGPWTDRVPLDFSCHSSELPMRVVRLVGAAANADAFAYPAAYPPDAQRFARGLRDELIGRPLLAVHRDTKPEKQWLDGRWAELLGSWSGAHPDGVVVDVGLSPASAEIDSRCGGRVLQDLRLPLAHALAVTNVADAFVGVDSCFLHAADLARVPCVALFFATDPDEFGLRWAEHRHLVEPDAPALSVERVFAALEELAATPVRVRGRASSVATRRAADARDDTGVAVREHRGLALGTVGLGTSEYSFARDRDVAAVLERMLALGANVIDLAANYGGGDACAVVGATLRSLMARGALARDEVFLCTKAGFTEHLEGSAIASSRGWSGRGHCLDADYLAWEFERQRRWLGVEAIDAFLLHNPEEQLAQGESVDTVYARVEAAFELFELLIAAGSLGCYGVSTVDALRVPRSHPLHIDLAEIEAAARRAGGSRHGFRVVEMPVSLAHLQACDVAAHSVGTDDAGDLPALEWTAQAGLLVLASAPLNRAHQMEQLAQPARELTGIDDDAAALLEVARAVPGVSCALVGMTSPRHVSSVALLTGRAPLDLTAPSPR